MNPNVYIQGAGMGGKPKPKAAVLRPPHTGYFPNIASYTVAEVVDLISDGPIYGLVNKSGQRDTIFQGIYFNNTPVESYSAENDGVAILSPSGAANPYTDWWSGAADFYDRFRYFKNNIETPENLREYKMWSYFYGAWRNQFMTLTVQAINQEGTVSDSGKAVLQFPFNNWDRGNNKSYIMPYNDTSGASTSPFNIVSTGSYTGDGYIQNYLWNAGNNGDLKKAIQESFYIKHDNNEFEIHYYNNEDDPTLGMARNGTILSNFENSITTLMADTGSNTEKVRYSFLKRVSKLTSKATDREFGVKAPLKYEDKFPLPDDDNTILAWTTAIEAIRPKDEVAFVFKIGSSGNYVDLGVDNGEYNNLSSDTYVAVEATSSAELTTNCKEFVDNEEESVKDFLFRMQITMGLKDDNYVSLLVPELAVVDNGSDYYSVRLTGKVFGVLIIFVPIEETSAFYHKKAGRTAVYTWGLKKYWEPDLARNIEVLKRTSARKFNFASVMCEFKKGTELQSPLKNFNYSVVDYEYQTRLFGPFRTAVTNGSGIFRIKEDKKLWPEGDNLEWDVTNWEANANVGALFLNSPTTGSKVKKAESSEDFRTYSNTTGSYSNWNDDSEWNEEATPFLHMVESRETTHVGFSLMIERLSDTLGADLLAATNKKAGDPYPTVLHMYAECGKIGSSGESDVTGHRFKIIGLVQSPTVIDFGCVSKTSSTGDNATFYENLYEKNEKPFIQESNTWDLNENATYRNPPTALFNPLPIPTLTSSDKFYGTKRFIRLYKISAETNSVLLTKDVNLLKISEIIKNKFKYPFSAIVGSKFDSRYFSSLPNRSFDCRLKLVKIPTNYEPLDQDDTDKRYLASVNDAKKQVYFGDWNGAFKMGWTDNPAWIIYDLLTSERYGLGNYIEKRQVNIWELYKIGRFCDAVDDFGYFQGVDDLNGGLEPRYSCNILFMEDTKIFDAINVVANLFRGSVFYNNSEINFADDRPKEPIAMFNNANVDEGVFNYSNYRKDQQYNTTEVAYIDRLDDYKTKIEYVEDAEDIRNRGVSKTKINTFGVTSRAMARRIGKHLIYQSIHENQTVEFSAGLEALLCRPGDLIKVDDEMKSRSRNFGRILEIGPLLVTGEYKYGTLTLDEAYDVPNYSNYINVYAPTGNYSQRDMFQLASEERSRVSSFELSTNNEISGNYTFSGYSLGYADDENVGEYLQYAVYTGASERFCYYSTGSGKWLFVRSGTLYGKANSSIVGIQEIEVGLTSLDLPNGSGLEVFDFEYNEEVYGGVTDDELQLMHNTQTARFFLSDKTNSSYGCTVVARIPNSSSLLIDQYNAIEAGSVYRFENETILTPTYKVISIRENSANSYSVVATKYDTSKYTKIDNLTREEIREEYSFNGIVSLEDSSYGELSIPSGLSGTRSLGVISVSWSGVANAQNYRVVAYNKEEDISKAKNVASPTVSTTFTYNEDTVTSKWRITVVAEPSPASDYSASDAARIVL